MKDWLNEVYHTNFDAKQLDEILSFSLIWNVFEGKLFASEFTLKKLSKTINDSNLELGEFQIYLDYFRKRYTNKNGLNERFQHLNIKKEIYQESLTKTLLKKEENPNKQIFSIGIIAYRYRCNLFHGIKQFEKLDEQLGNFEIINEFLKTFIHKLQENNVH